MPLSGSFSTSILSGHYTLRVDWSATQSVANNTSVVTVKAYLVNDWALNVGARYNNAMSVAGVATTYTCPAVRTTGTHLLTTYTSGAIAHNDDGTKSINISVSYRMNATINGVYYGTMTASSTVTLTTIARASQPSCITWPEHTQNVGNFGSTISIHMNRKSDSFTHTVRYAFGTQTGTIATSVTTGTTWTIPTSFMNLIPSDTQGSGTIYVDTYNGSTLIGTKWCGFTATVPTSAKPSCTATLTDITGVGDIYGSPVRGLSQIKVTVNPTLSYSSPIKTYAISINGAKYASNPATSEILVGEEASLVSVTVTDARGRPSAAWTYDMKVKDYTRPSVSKLAVHRCDALGNEYDQGQYVQATFSAAVSSMDSKNTVSCGLRYKKTSASTWTEVSFGTTLYTYTDRKYIFAADESSTYDVEVFITDRHYTATRATSVSTAFSLIDYHPSGRGIRFGGVAEDENLFRVSMEAKFDKAVQGKVYGLGTLERIPDYSNLNDYVVPGVYGIPSDASAQTISNMPKETAGRLIVSDSTGTEPSENFDWEYKEQLFLPHDIGRGGVPWVRQLRRQKSTQWSYYAWHTYGLFAYPVGSIYISYTHDNPATLFGGTWQRIENRFLWATTASGTIGQTGGESEHTLTVNEMPAHTHGSVYSQHASGTKDKAWYTTSGSSVAYGTVSTGGGAAHNNMPPYIQVSIWRRTA